MLCTQKYTVLSCISISSKTMSVIKCRHFANANVHNKTGSPSSSTNYPFRCFVTHKKYAVLKTFFCQRMCTGDLDCFFVIFPLPLKYSVWLFEPLRTHCTGPFPKIRHALPFHTICSSLFTNNFLMRKAQYGLLLRGFLLNWWALYFRPR